MKNPTALIGSHQIPLLEWDGDPWRIWIDYNRDHTAGTFLELHSDGSITRAVLLPTGEVTSHAIIKPRS